MTCVLDAEQIGAYRVTAVCVGSHRISKESKYFIESDTLRRTTYLV